MEFQDLKQNWNEFGQQDPLWAILSDPTKKNNQWDLQEFFQSGRTEIDRVIHDVDGLTVQGQPLQVRRHVALDFGCGVGRLSQALCQHFEQVRGVDIAASMIDQARQYNQFGDRCQYFLNEKSDLSLFESGSVDFIYSNIVLQHMRPDFSQQYLCEFLRLLSPGGVLVFQLPGELVTQLPQADQARSFTDQTLADGSFQAEIQAKLPKLEANVPIALPVTVTNRSAQVWPALGNVEGKYQVKLGGYWLSSDGTRLPWTEARANFIQDLAPGESTTLELVIHPPTVPGQYILELDLVQELITWFKDKGSPSLQIPTTVQAETALAKWQKRLTAPNLPQRLLSKLRSPVAQPSQPEMEMYGIPQELVIDLLTRYGGEVIDIQQDQYAGPEWTSYRYCVRKRA